ncbi:MAG: hypothetical protein Kow00109_13600 [Acidobacteriota bacterium]
MKDLRWIVAAVLLVVVAALVSYGIYTRERERRAALEAAEAAADLAAAGEVQATAAARKVVLFRYRTGALPIDEDFLVPEEVELDTAGDPESEARTLLTALFHPPGEAPQVIPEAGEPPREWWPYTGIELRAFYLLDDGTAVVDLEVDRRRSAPAGVLTELVVVESIVRTLRENLPEVTQVRFLVAGRAVRTLLGHVEIERPFR